MSRDRKKIAILISGRGSNMSALIEAAREPDHPATVVGVISDRAEAPGIERATAVGVPAETVARADYADRAAHEGALEAALARLDADIVCLAGYMRMLSPEFVARWAGRLINIHPSLLPLFRGLDTHRRCLEAGMRIHGASVHFVTDEMDGGPIVAQVAVPVLAGDDEAALAARVLRAEHRLYPFALRLVAEGRVRLEGGRAVADGWADAEQHSQLFSPSPDTAFHQTDIEALARFTP